MSPSLWSSAEPPCVASPDGMATLRFSFGTMGSGKSTVALQIHHNLSSRELLRPVADVPRP